MVEVAREAQRESVERGNRRNRQVLRALVIPVEKGAVAKRTPLVGGLIPEQEGLPGGGSKSVAEDPFLELGLAGEVIEPPFDLLTLAMLPEQNTELTPVLETMETNIDGFGYLLQPRVDVSALGDGEALRLEVRREKVRLTNFFNYANLRDSFICLRRKLRKDLESTGNGYWEIIRDAAGEIQGIEHLPAYQVRLARIEKDPIEVETPILLLKEDGSVELAAVKTWQRFRKFVQARLTSLRGMHAQGGYRQRYFKEFGDPRIYDNETGKEVPPEKVASWRGTGKPMPGWLRANEVVHFKLYSSRTPYGLPRYIGSLLSIFGARAAEEINYVTFRNNNIPSMMVLVSNGQLTEGTIGRIESFVESQIQGSDNYSKFLIIEAEGMAEGEDAGSIKIDVQPLTQQQLKDALFQNYTRNNQDNVRRAFRIPPIFVGRADDYSRATAETSRKLADEQIFAPERDEFDAFMNRRFFPAMKVLYHRFKSNSPNTTDNRELVSMLSGSEKTGAMTPRIGRIVLEDILGRELPPMKGDERFDPDLPFSLSMAEAVKNRADPTEPGQQLTALKALGILGEDGQQPGDGVEEAVVRHVLRLRRELEGRWEAAVADLERGSEE